MNKILDLVDIIRIDHFRGFEAYWRIPGDAETAEKGKWIKAPGEKFFSTLREFMGELPILAEDLGVITKQVEELRDKFEFPGMKILHCIRTGMERRFTTQFSTQLVVYMVFMIMIRNAYLKREECRYDTINTLRNILIIGEDMVAADKNSFLLPILL
jgi:hypothetical protein